MKQLLLETATVDRYTYALADINCWLNGFKAAGGEYSPQSTDALQSLRIHLDGMKEVGTPHPEVSGVSFCPPPLTEFQDAVKVSWAIAKQWGQPITLVFNSKTYVIPSQISLKELTKNLMQTPAEGEA